MSAHCKLSITQSRGTVRPLWKAVENVLLLDRPSFTPCAAPDTHGWHTSDVLLVCDMHVNLTLRENSSASD